MFKIKRLFAKIKVKCLRKEMSDLDFKMTDIEDYLDYNNVPWAQLQLLKHQHADLQLKHKMKYNAVERLVKKYAL